LRYWFDIFFASQAATTGAIFHAGHIADVAADCRRGFAITIAFFGCFRHRVSPAGYWPADFRRDCRYFFAISQLLQLRQLFAAAASRFMAFFWLRRRFSAAFIAVTVY